MNDSINSNLVFKVFSVLNIVFGKRPHIYKSELEGKRFDGLLQMIQENYGIKECTADVLKTLLPLFLKTLNEVNNKVFYE